MNQHGNVAGPVGLPPWRTILQVLRYILRSLVDIPRIIYLLERIMATQQELANALNAVNTTLQSVAVELDKVQAETQTSLQKITDLETVINTGGNTSPEVDAALQAVRASVQSVADKVSAVDNMVPDTPVGPDTSALQGQLNQSTTQTSQS